MAVAAFFALVAFPRATIPLVDGDVWWHLRAGEEILRTGAVPSTDTWTIAGQGLRWISQDWLTNVLMAGLHALAGSWGDTALSLAFGLAVVAAFALLWSAIGHRAPRSGWLTRIGWLTAGLIVAGPVIGVRVQTLDLVMSALTVWLLWGYLADRRRRWLVGLPLAATLWVNLHAGYPTLFLLGGAVLVGEALDRSVRRPLADAPLTWRQLRDLGVALAVAAAALLLNPNGWAIYAYPFQTAAIQAHRDFIFEWSRPDLSSFPGQALFAFLLLGVIPTLALGRRSLRACDALWLIGVTLMSFLAIRFVLLAGPIGAAIAAIELGPRLASWPPAAPLARIVSRMANPPRRRGLARVNALLLVAILVGGTGVALTRSLPAVEAQAIGEAMPVQAAAWLRSHGPVERVFNVYSWGGYLGRELPGTLVYIDGRSDIYGNAPIQAYAAVVELRSDPQVMLDGARIDHIVFWPDSALAAWLDRSPAWRRTYTDPLAAIWVRRPGSSLQLD